MNITVKVSFSSRKTLEQLGLGESHKARRYLAARVKARCRAYVPFSSGTLNNTAVISADGRTVTYTQPYAHYQYIGLVMGPNVLTNRGWRSMAKKGGKYYTGKKLTYHSGGPKWDKRMMAAHRQDIEEDMRKFFARRGDA